MNDIILPVIIGVVAIIVGYGIAKIFEKNKLPTLLSLPKKGRLQLLSRQVKMQNHLKRIKCYRQKKVFRIKG